MFLTNKKLHARHEKARKKRKVEQGFRGRVKKFILDRLSKKKLTIGDFFLDKQI